jgi:hypothetical protein
MILSPSGSRLITADDGGAIVIWRVNEHVASSSALSSSALESGPPHTQAQAAGAKGVRDAAVNQRMHRRASGGSGSLVSHRYGVCQKPLVTWFQSRCSGMSGSGCW